MNNKVALLARCHEEGRSMVLGHDPDEALVDVVAVDGRPGSFSLEPATMEI